MNLLEILGCCLLALIITYIFIFVTNILTDTNTIDNIENTPYIVKNITIYEKFIDSSGGYTTYYIRTIEKECFRTSKDLYNNFIVAETYEISFKQELNPLPFSKTAYIYSGDLIY